MPRSDDRRAGARPNAGGRDVMDDFLNRIGRVELLTPSEERELGTAVQQGLVARHELEASPNAEVSTVRKLQQFVD